MVLFGVEGFMAVMSDALKNALIYVKVVKVAMRKLRTY